MKASRSLFAKWACSSSLQEMIDYGRLTGLLHIAGVIVLSLLGTFALGFSTADAKIWGMFSWGFSNALAVFRDNNGLGEMVSCLTFVALLSACFVSGRFRLRWCEAVVSAVFAAVMFQGKAMDETGGLVIPGSLQGVVILLLLVLGWFFVCVVALSVTRCLFSYFKIYPKWERISQRRLFLIVFLVIFSAWMPYMVLRFPAAFEWDAYHQLEMYLGVYPLSSHWPLASTYFFGGLFSIGETLLGSEIDGIFLVALIQTILCAAAFAYSIVSMNIVGISRGWQIVVLVLFSLCGVFPMYLTALVKDALYTASIVVFFSLLAQVLFCPAKTNRMIITLGIAAMLTCFLRSNGIFAVLGGAVTLALVPSVRRMWKRTKGAVAVMLVAVAVFSIFSLVIAPAFGVAKGSFSQVMSVPFQQTARYLQFYPDDVEPWEREAIGAILEYDKIAESYDVEKSDPVLNLFTGNTEAVPRYMQAWLSMSMKHPMIYHEAFWATWYGFMYPGTDDYRFYKSTNHSGWPADITLFDFADAQRDVALTKLEEISISTCKSPVFYPFCNAGIISLSTLYLILWSIRSRNIACFVLSSVSMVGVLVCLASMTFFFNGFRYILPVIACNPLLIGYCLGTSRSTRMVRGG